MLESFQSLEKRETLPKQIINAFELSSIQEEKLKQIIIKNKGNIRIFIHPYYNTSNMTIGNSGILEKKDEKLMHLGFEKLIGIKGDDKTPLFVFEEKNQISDLNDKVKEKLGRSIFLIPTHQDNSTPFFNEFKEGNYIKEDQKSWNYLTLKFKEWGVQKITLAGQSLALSFDEDGFYDSSYQFEGCAGQALSELEDNFDIQVSRFSYPLKRKDYNYYKKLNDEGRSD